MKLPLSTRSLNMISTIANCLKAYPDFRNYEINSYCYDPSANVYAIDIKRNGDTMNLFLFYPDIRSNGEIGSIAIFGANLEGHLDAIQKSGSLFGLRVKSASIDRSGISDYVDVYL